MRLTRRLAILSGSALALGALRPARAAAALATVTAATEGSTLILPDGTTQPLAEGAALAAGAQVATRASGRVGLTLADGTLVNAGENTRIELVAGIGKPDRIASLNVSGAAVVDRRAIRSAPSDVMVAGALEVKTDRFEVIIEEARIYLASLDGGKLLVSDGAAHLVLASAEVTLEAGDGLTLAPPPPPRSAPAPGAAPAEEAAGLAESDAASGAIIGRDVVAAIVAGKVLETQVYRVPEGEMEAAFASVGASA
jgi:hypothetical protein